MAMYERSSIAVKPLFPICRIHSLTGVLFCVVAIPSFLRVLWTRIRCRSRTCTRRFFQRNYLIFKVTNPIGMMEEAAGGGGKPVMLSRGGPDPDIMSGRAVRDVAFAPPRGSTEKFSAADNGPAPLTSQGCEQESPLYMFLRRRFDQLPALASRVPPPPFSQIAHGSLSSLLSCGGYWDRTGDLCRVQAHHPARHLGSEGESIRGSVGGGERFHRLVFEAAVAVLTQTVMCWKIRPVPGWRNRQTQGT